MPRWVITMQSANVGHPSLDVVVHIPHKKHFVGEGHQVWIFTQHLLRSLIFNNPMLIPCSNCVKKNHAPHLSNSLETNKKHFTTRNLVICNESLCNWHATNCRLQLFWSCLQLQIWYCIIFGPYGCVCN